MYINTPDTPKENIPIRRPGKFGCPVNNCQRMFRKKSGFLEKPDFIEEVENRHVY